MQHKKNTLNWVAKETMLAYNMVKTLKVKLDNVTRNALQSDSVEIDTPGR